MVTECSMCQIFASVGIYGRLLVAVFDLLVLVYMVDYWWPYLTR